MPFTVETPTRAPVNEPGPTSTAHRGAPDVAVLPARVDRLERGELLEQRDLAEARDGDVVIVLRHRVDGRDLIGRADPPIELGRKTHGDLAVARLLRDDERAHVR